ncbi:MAG: UDP-N-acetylmuramoyl-L-alanine--D-glutamate ligase [Thermodesulfovibrionales bacterium]|nr:UDP-N-acetylmuramoyl-L-alanine--D-glutamate ligase [Thermodesulfovibrionales bacterium]
MEIKGKKILIFGLARSGAGAANLLARSGAEVTATDKKSKGELTEFVERLLPSVRLALGGHPDGIFKNTDLIVISPGVPLDILPLKKAKDAGIKIIGELELAYQIIQGLGFRGQGLEEKTEPIPNPQSQIPFLAVTGTNGKSTTTSLIYEMIKNSGFKAILGGNIGNALTEEIYKIQKSEEICPRINLKNPPIPPLLKGGEGGFDFIVAEVSSFQLESIDEFRPNGATILNITPDHLDRYHSMDEYRDAKAQVFLNQKKEDFLVLNADDPEVMRLYDSRFSPQASRRGDKIQDSGLPDVYFFSRQKEVKGVYLKDGSVCSGITDSQLIRADEIRIKGVHNLENAMAASAMALLAKCPVDAIVKTLKEFPGLEHRLEFVRDLDGVDYINDSKGTNVGAVIKSLESFSGPVILIAGGRDKAGDFSILRPLVKERVKALVLIGEAREKINKALGDLTETRFADDFKEAVMISRRCASRGDVVLLSPACASFDMFRDFEDRGRQFKKIVGDLN